MTTTLFSHNDYSGRVSDSDENVFEVLACALDAYLDGVWTSDYYAINAYDFAVMVDTLCGWYSAGGGGDFAKTIAAYLPKDKDPHETLCVLSDELSELTGGLCEYARAASRFPRFKSMLDAKIEHYAPVKEVA